MSENQYASFHLYMSILTHVWNCTPDADTNITPFEAEHGMRCRSVAESLVQDPPKEGLPASADDLKTIAIAAKAYAEIISNIKAIERARTANKLNSYGQPVKRYEIGERVTFYLPPNDAEAKRMGKNPKHMLQYQGPGVVVESLSNNNTSYRIKCGTRHYNRNIMHMSPYTSAQEVPAQLMLHIDDTVSVGTYVAVLDKDDDVNYHLAKVLDINENTTSLHYYCTKGKRLRSAKWEPLYVLPNSNLISTVQPDTIDRNHRYFTGAIDTRSIDDSLILLANIGMTDSMRVNARTRKILSKKSKYKHHRITITWNP